MKVEVKSIEPRDEKSDRFPVVVEFLDDDRDRWVRSCEVEISLNNDIAKSSSLVEIQKLAIDEAYHFLKLVLAGRVA